MLLCSLLWRRLPELHFRDNSKYVVSAASGMIATLVAQLIGFLNR